ncbi:MAG: hypothetical protein QXY79_01320, partial [Candidatus Methanomethylicia archaeon]
IRIDQIKTVKIPVSGGISVNIETPETMYAGEPYEFTYTVKNNYESDIYFDVQVGMLSSYGSGVVFSHPYKVRKSTLSSKAYYQDTVYIDPEKLTVVEDTCPYNTLYLGLAKGMNKITEMEEKIECSKEKKCKDPKSACVKIDFFECKCVDWVELTCSKNDIKVKMTVEHDGVFIGNGSLYYSETITSPARSTELVQGPLSVIIEFLPNPYIASIHQYIEDVSVYVTLKNQGGTIKIKDFKLEPIDTVIHTINKENGVELIEEIGVDVISCRDITEIVPEGIMSYGSEVGGKICSVTPPFVKTTIKDLEKNTIVELNNVTFSGLKYFCEKETPNYLNQNESKLNWSKYWDKIYELVGESGLCEILKKKEGDNDKIIVSNALKHVDVELTITYERTGDYYSKNIVPYTRTEKCIERLNQ